jgi:hypothetical protein
LKCGHIFHLNCLRRWLETNVQCPTCRDKIELDAVAGNQGQREREQRRQDQAARRRLVRLARRLDIPVPPAVGQLEEEEAKAPELPREEPLASLKEGDATEVPSSKAPQTTETEAELLEKAKQRELRLSRFRSA